MMVRSPTAIGIALLYTVVPLLVQGASNVISAAYVTKGMSPHGDQRDYFATWDSILARRAGQLSET
jgi:hypothetical protein